MVAVKDITVSPLGMRTGDRWDLRCRLSWVLGTFFLFSLFPYFTNIYLVQIDYAAHEDPSQNDSYDIPQHHQSPHHHPTSKWPPSSPQCVKLPSKQWQQEVLLTNCHYHHLGTCPQHENSPSTILVSIFYFANKFLLKCFTYGHDEWEWVTRDADASQVPGCSS